jgi:hypothetical protein
MPRITLLSFGKLMYPKKYTSFKQTNINLMVEFVGQTINENGKSYLMLCLQFNLFSTVKHE